MDSEVRTEDAFDVDAVQRWLAAHADVPAAVPTVRQFRGGASNLTYLLDYGGAGRLVLRRPPHGRRAAAAHDMGREVRVMRGLAPYLPVVPRVVAYCPDPAVIGAEFSVMEYRAGVLLGAELPPGVTLSAAAARALSETVVDTLAELHAVDVDAAGLAALGRGPGYVRRQVAGWSRRYRDARTADLPDAETVMGWLAAHQRPDVAACLLHGDWKLDNLLLSLDGRPRVVGVLDWEMATVGDPLMDLGASLAYWITADDEPLYGLLRRQPSHLPGMLTREQMVARYAARTGRAVEDWTFYEVFGLFRLAVIIAQIWARYSAGATTNPAFAQFGAAVGILVDRAERIVGGAG